MRFTLALVLALGCTSHQSALPKLLNPRLTPPEAERSVVVGRILSKVNDSLNFPHVVVVDTVGRPYQIMVMSLTTFGPLKSGQHITAWCHGAAGDLVADSVRIDE